MNADRGIRGRCDFGFTALMRNADGVLQGLDDLGSKTAVQIGVCVHLRSSAVPIFSVHQG
jgi:hypothetical protein